MNDTAINILRTALVNAIIKNDAQLIVSAKAMLVRRLKNH